jgi:hypothetical protein
MRIGSRGIPHLAKNERDIGHPRLVVGTEFDRQVFRYGFPSPGRYMKHGNIVERGVFDATLLEVKHYNFGIRSESQRRSPSSRSA